MKNLKKLISVLLLVGIALLMTACGKFTCDLCMEEKSGKKHESEMLGTKVTVCDDCYKSIESMFGY